MRFTFEAMFAFEAEASLQLRTALAADPCRDAHHRNQPQELPLEVEQTRKKGPARQEDRMRALALAATLLLSFAPPSFAEQEGAPPAPSRPQTAPAQPQTVPMQPERTPQQSEQSRKEDQRRGEDVQVDRGWRAHERDDESMDRSMGHDWDHRKPGRDWRMRGDDDDDYADRPRRRVKICFEYENGDEYCRYRR